MTGCIAATVATAFSGSAWWFFGARLRTGAGIGAGHRLLLRDGHRGGLDHGALLFGQLINSHQRGLRELGS